MKQLINPLPAGRMPVYKDDLLILQDEAYIATRAICAGIDEPMIVSGCVATDLGSGNVSITAGVVYIDNEIIKFNGYSGSYPVYIKQGTPVTSTKIYFDSSVQTVYRERIMEVTTSLPGSGQFITFNYDNNTNRLLNALAIKFKNASTAWLNLDGGGLFKYRKDAFGFVHLVGVVGAGFGTIANDTALPVGFRPASTQTFYLYRYDNNGGGTPNNLGVSTITIDSAGVIHSTWTTGAGVERQHPVTAVSFKCA